MANKSSNSSPWITATWIVIALLSLVWWYLAGLCNWQRTVLLVWLSLASIMVGCLIGFLFSSFGEENNSLGKIRDWLIGAITALTVIKAQSIKDLLMFFVVSPSNTELAYAIAAATFYTGLGFLFMFFQRELIINVLLAKSRAERGKLEGTQQAGQVTQQVLAALPPSMLSGVDDIDEIIQFRKEEADRLHDLLYSNDVKTFLDQAEQASVSGTALDWDVVSKVAILHYYRTYFEKGAEKDAQAQLAYQWILRALAANPLHVDLTVKQADVLGMMKRYEEAIAILERLDRTPNAPAYVKQWLGYLLLYTDRLDDSIRYSNEYHRAFPEESDSLFNLACAYAQKFCGNGPAEQKALNRERALAILQAALDKQPDYAEVVRTSWIKKGESFECFVGDPAFRLLVGLPVDIEVVEE